MLPSLKSKNQSHLVYTVQELDGFYSELLRLGSKIENMDIKTDADFDLLQRLVSQFADCGQGLSTQVLELSKNLSEMRVRADTVTQLVAQKAEILKVRKTEEKSKMDEFRNLSEKVRALTQSLGEIRPTSENISTEERARISMKLSEFEMKLQPLIEEANRLKKVAQEAKMKALVQSADSLAQSLASISQKLSTFQHSSNPPH